MGDEHGCDASDGAGSDCTGSRCAAVALELPQHNRCCPNCAAAGDLLRFKPGKRSAMLGVAAAVTCAGAGACCVSWHFCAMAGGRGRLALLWPSTSARMSHTCTSICESCSGASAASPAACDPSAVSDGWFCAAASGVLQFCCAARGDARAGSCVPMHGAAASAAGPGSVRVVACSAAADCSVSRRCGKYRNAPGVITALAKGRSAGLTFAPCMGSTTGPSGGKCPFAPGVPLGALWRLCSRSEALSSGTCTTRYKCPPLGAEAGSERCEGSCCRSPSGKRTCAGDTRSERVVRRCLWRCGPPCHHLLAFVVP